MKILTEKEIFENYKRKINALKAIKYLKEKKLIPLISSSELSRIVGYLIGDGNLSKDLYVGDFRFYGSYVKLKQIKIDVSYIFHIQPKRFEEREGGFVLKYNNSIISRVLNLIGVPRGNKVTKKFGVPFWIKFGNKDIKRNFLVAICDDELSSPRKCKRGYIEPLRLKFNKTENLINKGVEFLEEIRDLFLSFDIKCSSIKLNNDKYINKNKEITRSIYFNISSNKDNLVKFQNHVGFKYELEKSKKLSSILRNH